MTEPNCPDQKQILEYLSGRLDRPKSDRLSAHIDTCAVCNTTISSLNPGPDKLVDGLQNMVSSSFADEPECSGVVQQIASQSPPVARVGGSYLTGAELIAEGAMLRDYRLFEQIGRGGMGAVHRAEHVRLKRPVAIKLLLTDRLQDDSAIARFNREMEAVGKLDHPNIVRATDAGDHDGTHFLVMELVDGPNLSQIARTVGPLRVADACELVRQAAEGLQHAYEHGLVHRDIKPSNLLLAGNGTVKILDLGLALLRENPADQDELTSSGQIMGTLDYMAPEQASDTHGVDIRADLYSLGCTLYHLLAGAPPFRGSQYSTILKKMMAHAQTPVPPLSNVRSDIPSELWTIIDRLLAKEPSDRYATPEQVAAALQPFAREARLSELMDEWRNSAEQDQESSASRSTVAPASSAQSDTLDPDSVQPAKSLAAQSAEDADGMAPTIMIEPEPASANGGRSGRQNRRRVRRVLAGFGGILLLGIVFFVGTGEGRVELTVNHRDIQVSVDGEPQQIRVLDGTNGVYRIELPNISAGRREMIVSRDGFSAETRHFWITRGGERTFEMKLAPQKQPTHSDSDRKSNELAVAEWVLSLGGTITTDINGSRIRAVSELPQMPFHIKTVEVAGTSVTDADIERLQPCSHLTRFACGGSSISEDGLRRLAELKLPLVFLAVHNCGIGDQGLRHLKSLKTLSSLTLTGTRITDKGIATITADFPELTSLFVGSTAISDASVPDLAKMTSLNRLQIDRTRISSSGAERLKAALPDTEIVTDGGSLTPLSEQGPSHALRFQGGADAVTVSDLTVRDSEPFTFEAWILVDSLPRTQHQAISLFKNTGGVGGDNIWVTHEGRLTYRIDRRTSAEEAVRPGGNMSMVSAGPLPMGRWIHVAAVRDGKLARLFVDGELLAHMSIPPARDFERTGFALGKSWHADARYGDIQIGWVRISRLPRYGKDFMPGITEKSDGETVALYLFDEGQGKILRDVSGGKHFNGVIDGAKWVRRQLDAAEPAKLSPEARDQRFAQWVLDRGGKLLSTDTRAEILVAEEAPGRGGNFAADFSAVSDFGDDDLRIMNSLRPARPIDLILRNTAVTDEGLAAIEGLPCWIVDLAGTSVTDRSAAVLATLPRLHILDLSGTRMTGASLAQLKSLPELQNLRLEGIPVSDNEFQSLDGCDLRNLVFSNLSTDAERAITDRSMPVVGRMHRMYWLALPDSITDDGIQHLGALTGLKKLKCNGEGVTDRSAGVFASFSELEVLELLDTGVTGETIDALTCEGSLSQLVLNGSVRIAPEAFGRLNRFRELTELYLNNTRITNGQLAALSELPLLKRLNLAVTSIDDAGLVGLTRFPTLEFLVIHRTSVTDAGVDSLSRLKALRTLDVTGTQISEDGLKRLREALPDCLIKAD